MPILPHLPLDTLLRVFLILFLSGICDDVYISLPSEFTFLILPFVCEVTIYVGIVYIYCVPPNKVEILIAVPTEELLFISCITPKDM